MLGKFNGNAIILSQRDSVKRFIFHSSCTGESVKRISFESIKVHFSKVGQASVAAFESSNVTQKQIKSSYIQYAPTYKV